MFPDFSSMYPNFLSGVVDFLVSLLHHLTSIATESFGLFTFSDSEDSGMSQEDVENPSPSSETLSEVAQPEVAAAVPHIAQSEVVDVVPQQTLPEENKYVPWFTISVVVISVGIFVIEMFKNNCQKYTLPRKDCFPTFFGRFAFQPIGQNPLIGPSRATLISMGGLYLREVHHMHQVWRLLSSIWLHEGLATLITNIGIILGVGIPLEQKFGFVRVGLLYIISGFGGTLFSGLFFQTGVIVGASGALAGLTAGTLSDILIEYLTLHLDKGLQFLVAIAAIIFNTAATVATHGDNFTNIGGSIFGFAAGFVIFIRPPVNRLRCTAGFILIIVGLLTGVVMLLKGVNINDHCSWCHYLDCIPFPGLHCKYPGSDCESSTSGNLLYLTCKGNGRSGVYPLVNDNPLEPFEELCYRLCR